MIKLKNILTYGLKTSGGRNNLGKITFFHRGGGHKQKYRLIDFHRNLFINIKAKIIKKFYDPNRTSFIFLICYSNGILSYILAFHKLNKKTNIIKNLPFENFFINGTNFYLFQIPFATFIHNVEFYKNNGGKLARSAGVKCILLKEFNLNYVILKLPSTEYKLISKKCKATLGQVSNIFHKFKLKKKASNNRHRNRRSIVRGVAMNAVDHAHGGGRGKTSGKNKTRLGKINKAVKTRLFNKTTNYTIIKKKIKKKK